MLQFFGCDAKSHITAQHSATEPNKEYIGRLISGIASVLLWRVIIKHLFFDLARLAIEVQFIAPLQYIIQFPGTSEQNEDNEF